MSRAIIIYETKTGNTKLIAEAIQESLKESGVEVLLKKIDGVDISELAGYECVILGAPTYHKDIIPTMKTFLSDLEKINLKDKIGVAFGAYGWSGESVDMITEIMKNTYSMDVLEPWTKLVGTISGAGQSQYRNLGKQIAEKMKEREK